MSRSLLTLFAPPQEKYHGDFGMLCGFTASRDVLDRIHRTFSGDSSRPRIAAFIHPTAAAVTDIPGVAWMHFRPGSHFHILHAKVALLGFRANDSYCLRLAVSTGNWTAEPLTTSIDMFWCDEFDMAAPDLQLASDIRAADDLFQWLQAKCDDSLLRQTFDGARPDVNFRRAIELLPQSPLAPRLVDTREQSMRRQVIDRMTGKVKGRLVMGSGYYEASEDAEAEGLIESLRAELVSEKKLANDATLDLVINPDNCQGLENQACNLVKNGWRLRKPGTTYAEHRQAKLHAKFLFLAEQAGPAEIGESQIYIGSGNFSRMGFESTGRSGNLEAGIIVTPDPKLSWRRNARNSICEFLPGNFRVEVELGDLKSGAAFEPPTDPPAPPPVTFVEWADGRLSVPDGCEVAVKIVGTNEQAVALPCNWPAPPPAFVALHPSGWKVPVRADGALVVPRRRPPSLEDILAGVGHFPAFALAYSEDEDDREGFDQEIFSETQEEVDNSARAYPVRQMMRLITRLSEAQKALDPKDWQRWCRELGQDLPSLAKTEPTIIGPFREACANPLRALANVEFLPAGVDVGRIEKALSQIEEAWGLSEAMDLWERTA